MYLLLALICGTYVVDVQCYIDVSILLGYCMMGGVGGCLKIYKYLRLGTMVCKVFKAYA